jgi:hypothetical protein
VLHIAGAAADPTTRIRGYGSRLSPGFRRDDG